MATFIPEVQANLPEVKLYTPPFEMIANFLDVKQQRYDAAATQLGSYYSQLQKLPLTLTDNIERRDQFIKDAEAQVKKLAEVDLSLPENYRAARNIFNPLLEDEDIITDMTFTLNQQALVQANQRFKNSPDEEDRKRYNPNNDAYAALKRQEFINASPELRKQMAQQSGGFVNNVNIFEIAEQIAKDNGLKMEWTSDAMTKDGRVPQVIFTGTNGERVVGYAYNKLMNRIGNDPFVKEYYNQQGYIAVQSELQELIPQVGYEQAIAQVSSKYQSLNSKPGEEAEKLEQAENDKYVAQSVVETHESKITKVGIIPGSKEHVSYVSSIENFGNANEETSNLVKKSYTTSVGQAQSLSDLYKIASDATFKVDLKNAAIDLAMSKSSRKLIENPLFLTGLKLRNTLAKEMEAAAAAGTVEGSGGLSFAERMRRATSSETSNIELAKGENAIEAISNVLASDAAELISGPNGMFGKAVKQYVANGGKFSGVDGGNLAATKIINEIQTLIKEGDLATASNKISNYLEVMKAGVDNGTITGQAALTIKELQQLQENQTEKYESFRQSLVDIIPAFIDQESTLEDGYFKNSPESAMILRYLIDEIGGVRNKKEFTQALQVALDNGELPQEAIDFVSQKAAKIGSLEAIEKRAQATFVQDIRSGIKPPAGMTYDKDTDRINVLLPNGDRKEMAVESAWNSLNNTPARDRYIKRTKEFYQTNPEAFQMETGPKVGYHMNKIYEDLYGRLSRLYDQAGNYSPLNTGVNAIDNGSYAVERLATTTLISPTNKNNSAKLANEQVFELAQAAITSDQAMIYSGTIKQNTLGIEEVSGKMRKRGIDKDGNKAYELYNQFMEDYAQEEGNEKKDGSTSARGTLRTISNLKIGNERFTAIQITPERDWIASNTSSTDDGKVGKLDKTTPTDLTILIPQEIVSSSPLNLPSTADEALYDRVINSGLDLTIPNLSEGSIMINDAGLIEIDVQIKEFNSEKGVYETKPYPKNGTLENNVAAFTYQNDQLSNYISLTALVNEEAIAEYNQNNGGVNDPDKLK